MIEARRPSLGGLLTVVLMQNYKYIKSLGFKHLYRVIHTLSARGRHSASSSLLDFSLLSFFSLYLPFPLVKSKIHFL